jgi:putative endonuclease
MFVILRMRFLHPKDLINEGDMNYFVYILTNKSLTLYIGVTNNLERRTLEHRSGLIPGFTAKYHLTLLVDYELFSDIRVAIQREKELKGWMRIRKIRLIESVNPSWKDLSEGWFN